MQILHEQPVLTPRPGADRAHRLAQRAGRDQRDAGGRPHHARRPGRAGEALAAIAVHRGSLSALDRRFSAHYRATAAYLASVVLIQRQRPARVGLPVQVREHPGAADGAAGDRGRLARHGRDRRAAHHSRPPFRRRQRRRHAGQFRRRHAGAARLRAGPRGARHRARRRCWPACAACRSPATSASARPADPHRGLRSRTRPASCCCRRSSRRPATVAVGTTLTLTINPPVGRRQRAAVLIGSQSVEIEPRPLSAPATSGDPRLPDPGRLRAGARARRSRCACGSTARRAASRSNTALAPPAYVPRIVVTP